MLLVGYGAALLLISFWQKIPLTGIIYGIRYDAEFLCALILLKHLGEFLPGKMSQYLRIAFISATWALIA